MRKLRLGSQAGQTWTWLSGLSARRARPMSAHVHPRLGVCLWLWLSVTLRHGLGQGKDMDGASWGSCRRPPPGPHAAQGGGPTASEPSASRSPWDPCSMRRQGRTAHGPPVPSARASPSSLLDLWPRLALPLLSGSCVNQRPHSVHLIFLPLSGFQRFRGCLFLVKSSGSPDPQ